MGQEPPSESDTATSTAKTVEAEDAPVGPVPKVLGKERMKAGIRAALFGDLDTQGVDPASQAGSSEVPEGDPDDVPDRLGRFRVLGELGRGGMGEVYSAYDPELDRKVAIKLLRRDVGFGSSGSQGPSRLQREAQAMARVNHPNVATVHEVGTLDGRLYVAMEFVDGGTLRDWQERRQRSVSELLAAYVQAGEGLAAAHAAGLVHRDFKPDNVLLGKDGRVRVVDFGLARRAVVDDAEIRPDASLIAHRDGDDPLESPLTQTGAVMGTPAYMSSEQHAGRSADARSDQFSFCVALWEAVMGERPFAGKTYPELMANVVNGRRREPGSGRGVPARVVGALERGLSPEPSHRFDDMESLLAMLRPRTGRRYIAAGAAGLVAVAIAATWVAARETGGNVDACDAVREELDGVWDDTRREASRAAMLASGHPFAADVWESTGGLLDDYADRWTAAASEVCAARLVADDTEVYERRRRCLDARRAELKEMVAVFEEGEPSVVLEAVQAVLSLSDVRDCSDERRLAAWRVPRDPAAQQELAQVRAGLGVAKVRGLMGRYDEAVSLAGAAAQRAAFLDDPATEAWGHLVQGQYLERLGEVKQAEATLRRAVSRSEVSDAHGIRAEALIFLVYVVGRSEERWPEANSLATEAAAVLRVIGSDPALLGKLNISLGGAARRADRHDEAKAFYEKALSIFQEHFGEMHLGTARSHSNLGVVLGRLGENESGERHLRQALAAFENMQGPGHPAVGIVLASLGNNLGYQERWRDAIVPLRRSLEIRQRSHVEPHQTVVTGFYNLGWALYNSRQYAEALRVLEEGFATQKRLEGSHPRSPEAWKQLIGAAALHSGDAQKAYPVIREVLDASPDGTATQVYLLAAVAAAHIDRSEARRLVRAGLARGVVETEEGKDRSDDIVGLEGLLAVLNSLDRLDRLDGEAHSTAQ